MKRTISINEAIEALQKAKRAIGGDKVLIISLTGSGLEMSDKLKLKTINDKESKYVEVRVGGFEGVGDHCVYQD